MTRGCLPFDLRCAPLTRLTSVLCWLSRQVVFGMYSFPHQPRVSAAFQCHVQVSTRIVTEPVVTLRTSYAFRHSASPIARSES